MNCVSLIGRLVRDPELRYAQTGTAMCRFTIAVDRRMSKQKRQEAQANNQPTADFIGCTAFGQTAELIANYHRKGSQIGIDGRIQTGSYEKDGRTIYTTDVVVNNLTFISTNQGQNQGGFNQNNNFQNQGGFNNPGPVNSAYENDFSQNKDDDEDGFFPVDNDNIPF
ncbi:MULTISPECIES: single-stranded DNA-binding protein [Peptoniphilus]|uniref:single-stranded DNA-binding protein n=1 Tax=Peptoniphilus TaxID=162289 RepID=UPI0002898E70|nr:MULTISPECIES: single-stranded DNA-binding protein [Peptoniphilus]MBS6610429.1 single-stranded DNA-binding protein [Peptoniphilus harei]MDU1043095.1 single-stranded DNA-binding protein [Peptoniphilus rhinitidis]MDU1955113.1 single-stranded DNA-binding protein [Peptoniphilus lacydonensis]MDU2109519.1 single-stranded DNA-binding protein [Peptoniphilus lacydonensis]MDU3750413.1 single-stranded DNA-binding protein [Peptoniphilus rhinitidis]